MRRYSGYCSNSQKHCRRDEASAHPAKSYMEVKMDKRLWQGTWNKNLELNIINTRNVGICRSWIGNFINLSFISVIWAAFCMIDGESSYSICHITLVDHKNDDQKALLFLMNNFLTHSSQSDAIIKGQGFYEAAVFFLSFFKEIISHDCN